MTALTAIARGSETAAVTTGSASQVLARHGKSFHLASRFLDGPTAERAARLYRFCRHVDDLADETGDPARARIRLTALANDLENGVTVDPIAMDFLALAAEVDMPHEPALELIQGVLSDLGPVRFETERALHRYCYRVAGTVGLMMCSVLGVDDPAAAPFAIDLGVAMQLTNIARDIDADARMDRRYLPASIVGRLEPGSMLEPDVDVRRRLRHGVQWLLEEADRFYASGEEGLVYLPERARLGIRVAARVYARIGAVLESWAFASWRGRAVVPTKGKVAATAGAVLGERSARLADTLPVHDRVLHRCLGGLPGSDDRLLSLAS